MIRLTGNHESRLYMSMWAGTSDELRRYNKLWEYENTGMEPEEVEELKKERLSALADLHGKCSVYDAMGGLEDDEVKEALAAAREDRSIIPPVRIGETIYHITTCKNFPQVLDGTMYDFDGGAGTATGYYCPCELQENCPHPLNDGWGIDYCDKHKNQLAVFTDTVESIFVSQNEEVMNFNYSGSADFSDFGRTVFRDYDKAKAALEAIKNGKND